MNFALRRSFFVCTFSVDPKIVVMDGGGGGGGRDQNMHHVLFTKH